MVLGTILGLFLEKHLGRSDNPIPHISTSQCWSPPQNFETFKRKKNFQKVGWKKHFWRKDAYRITWLGRKSLGDRVCTISDPGQKRLSLCSFDHFWSDPQIRGCVWVMIVSSLKVSIWHTGTNGWSWHFWSNVILAIFESPKWSKCPLFENEAETCTKSPRSVLWVPGDVEHQYWTFCA